ncbi:single-stranded DNA-binding protein [Ohessyouella blattaphilus]|uniref:Single-stranded DNA-binding protein n=1 Tax=Ohessyouella blattaphilus TaxID=2949333 RepID=A0ABT1EIM6_9FIRM|nr:single-stranded DNA-binding protein [Ohessyouella blattaphilus]MCP1110558.1 single-stranded DNA-binding protein [Ohessyouella blattaphilus]MCR8563952.1 single-stranded DNA-binding protein [Ohessyouella blattaphilus]
MPTIKFSLNDEYFKKLEKAAEDKGMTIQDYIRYKLFDLNTIFTVEEAVRRVQNGGYNDETFSLPDLYKEEWTLERGMAGVFGKNFYNFISEHTELGIKAQGYDKKIRREIYTYKKED